MRFRRYDLILYKLKTLDWCNKFVVFYQALYNKIRKFFKKKNEKYFRWKRDEKEMRDGAILLRFLFLILFDEYEEFCAKI